MKFEFLIVPLCPFQKIAPPDLLAMLFTNSESDTKPSCAPAYQSIAPPLVPALLSSKYELVIVMFLFPCSHDHIYIAPPRPLFKSIVLLTIALLFMNLLLVTVPFVPAQNIAPPSPLFP